MCLANCWLIISLLTMVSTSLCWLSVCLLVATVQVAVVDGVIEKAWNTAVKAGEKIGDTAITESMNTFCELSGEQAEKAAEAFTKGLKCDEKQAWCKVMANGGMIWQVICGMAKDHKAEAFKNMMKCASTTDKKCFENFYNQFKSAFDAAQQAGKMAG